MIFHKIVLSLAVILSVVSFSQDASAQSEGALESQKRVYKGQVTYAVGNVHDLQGQPCQVNVRSLNKENFNADLLISHSGNTDPRVLRTELSLSRDSVGAVNKILGYDYAYESVFEMGDVQLSVAKKLKLTNGGKSLKVSVMNQEKDLGEFFNPVYYAHFTCEAHLAD